MDEMDKISQNTEELEKFLSSDEINELYSSIIEVPDFDSLRGVYSTKVTCSCCKNGASC